MALPALTAPFRVANMALPSQMALLCRLLAVAFLATGQSALLQSPYLPYLDLPTDPVSGPRIQIALQIWAGAAAIGLLFTSRVRTFALLLAAAIAAAHLVSRAYSPAGLALAASLLTLAALSPKIAAPRLVLAQYAILYLHPESRPAEWILAAAAAASMLPAGRATSLLHSFTAWGSAVWQCFLLWEAGPDSGFHFLAAQAGLLAFLPWPASIAVFYDGACGFCAASKRLASRFDLDGLFDWRAQHAGAPADFCPAPAEARGALATDTAGRIRRGYLAWRHMVAHLPVASMLAILALSLAPQPRFRLALAAAVLVVLSPLSNPFGNAFYGFIARRRHALSALNSKQ